MSHMDWDIIGHAWAANMLQQHIAGGMMRRAYLFSGPTGVGRRTLALRFAQAIFSCRATREIVGIKVNKITTHVGEMTRSRNMIWGVMGQALPREPCR